MPAVKRASRMPIELNLSTRLELTTGTAVRSTQSRVEVKGTSLLALDRIWFLPELNMRR